MQAIKSVVSFPRAFISADKDFDGKVDEGEFEGMISAAAAFPQKFGFEFWKDSGKDQFSAIDENGDGAVSFDEWLGFAYGHYKAQSLSTAFDKLDKETFVKDCKNVGDTASEAYKKIYWFSWKCFQAADADRDGQVSDTEFGTMINVATAAQKRLGRATIKIFLVVKKNIFMCEAWDVCMDWIGRCELRDRWYELMDGCIRV